MGEQGLAGESKGEYGCKKLVVWKNARKFRKLIYDITESFPKAEMRRISQMRDAARSVKQNIQEGYMRSSIGEYIHFLTFSQGSLGELNGDVEDCLEDALISKQTFMKVDSLIGRTDYLLKRLIQSLQIKRSEQKVKK